MWTMCSGSMFELLDVRGSIVRGGFLLDLRGEAARFEIVLLPFGHVARELYLHGGDFVFGAVRGPVGKFRSDDVGAGHGVMERGVDDSRLHAFGNTRGQS